MCRIQVPRRSPHQYYESEYMGRLNVISLYIYLADGNAYITHFLVIFSVKMLIISKAPDF